MDQHLRELLNERHESLMAVLVEIKDQVKATNGRLGRAEMAIAILQWAYGLAAAAAAAWFFNLLRKP